MNDTLTQRTWWGTFDLAEGATGYWRTGPLKLWVQNLAHEWRVYQHQEKDPLDHSLEVTVPSDAVPDDKASVTRFSFSTAGDSLSITPVLADRAVVVKPEDPFYVPSGGEATLYVSTPVWLRLELSGAGKLLDIPSWRPTDTWFGPSTLVGELCYGSRTAGRLSLEELEYRPHRAITPVQVRNRASNPLLLDKVKLPVQYLGVYTSQSNFLWTQTVTLVREEDGDLAGLQVAKSVPAHVGKVEQLSPPRQHAERNLVVRAFSKLLDVF